MTVNMKPPATVTKLGIMAIWFVWVADGEHEATRHGHEVGDDGRLVRLGSCTHTLYLACHCRRKLVGNLPWGIPTVVDCR